MAVPMPREPPQTIAAVSRGDGRLVMSGSSGWAGGRSAGCTHWRARTYPAHVEAGRDGQPLHPDVAWLYRDTYRAYARIATPYMRMGPSQRVIAWLTWDCLDGDDRWS